MTSNKMWTLNDALMLCKRIEEFAPVYGCHVALTGGLLYKDGPRKDCDIVFYRIRQCDTIDWDGLIAALREIGFQDMHHYGFVTKAMFGGVYSVDILRPEYGMDSDYEKTLEEIPRHEVPVVSEAKRQYEISALHPLLEQVSV